MTIHLVALGALALVFAIASLRPINMGLLAFGAAFLIGLAVAGMPSKDVLGNFPGDLFVTLVGVTFLFAVAQHNGAIEWLTQGLERLTSNRASLAPWVIFVVGAALTGFGALGPAAVAIVAPIALRYADRHRISPLMMGLMAIHGAQAGAFSPISIYGGIVTGVAQRSGIPVNPTELFVASLLFNLVVAFLIFAVLGGRDLLRHGHDRPVADAAAAAAIEPGLARERMLTLVVLAATAIAAIVFKIDIGAAAMIAAAFLAIAAPASQKDAAKHVAWSTVLLICGVVTYVGLLQEIGTVSLAGQAIAAIGMPVLGALLLCSLAGIVSAFASSTALLGILVPLAGPLLQGSGLGAAGTVAAIAVATTIVDTSPFSTNGALVVANAPDDRRAALFRQLLIYTGLIVVAGPMIAWAVFVLPAY